MGYGDQIQKLERAQKILDIKKIQAIEKALKSENPSDIIAGTSALSSIQPKTDDNAKSFFIDPLEFNTSLGYKDKPYALSYTSLRRMSAAPIINAILKTRKNQIADFAEPQADKYSTGFIVRKKLKFGQEQKMSEKEKKIANAITDFLLNCGESSSWVHDDFDTFIRKIVDDSLIYDQMTFECLRNKRGKLVQFMATDAATFRKADSAFDADYSNDFFKRGNSGIWQQDKFDYGKKVLGYYPTHVQIYQNVKINEFYPWELCFGVRNPSTNIRSNGYGVSELEELINVITSMLWGDEYNRRFFSQGSAPKGLLRVKGNMNESSLQQFKQQWQAMITGVMQSWKTPIVEADVDWIDLQKNNRDMEYTAWTEYLIKIACAVYSMDPSEIGWDISKTGGNTGLFEGGQKERLQNSKDKGLYPLLKFIQRKVTKFVVEQIHPDFEFMFVGMNGQSISDELDMDIKKVGSFTTINETREKWNMEPLPENGDIVENSVYAQRLSAADQKLMQQSMMGSGAEGNGTEEEQGNPFDKYSNEEEQKNPFDEYGDEEDDEEKAEENVFVKAFDNFLKQEENGIIQD